MSRELAATIYSGLVIGSMYALMSMGLALVWGGLRVLNLAQGAFYMAGAYVALALVRGHLPILVALVGAFAAMFLLGGGLYSGPVRRLADRDDSENATILLTFGIATIFDYVALLIFGPDSQNIPNLVNGQFTVGGVVFTWYSVMMIVASVVLLTALGAALKLSRFGLAIRALAQQPEGAQLSGISRHRTAALIFALSAGLAGVGGVLLSSYYFVTPYVGDNYLLLALIVTILGGLGSMTGTLAAAYVVGLIQALTSLYLGVRWSLPVLFLLIILVLLFRPAGLAGRVAQERL
jgi:branched-chain amino acid transport system permease protein